jgi:hypothetical protein
VGVADPDRGVRQRVLASLTPAVDPLLLASPSSLLLLAQAGTHDEAAAVREVL